MSTVNSTDGIGTALAKGSAWMVALRWAIRFVGLINTYILVRLLNPSDFGIVAMAMIFVGLVETVADSGQKLAVIKHASPQPADFDTAWTMSVLIGLAVGAVILLLSPLTKFYFNEPRAVGTMQWLALRAVIGGFENTGVLNFRRDLRFDRHFSYLVGAKIISIPITIAAAVLFRDYRALIAGIISAQIVMVILSFVLSSYRPRFSLSKLGEMWGFSAWSSVRSVGLYLNDQVDQLAIGGVFGSSVMGRYRVASDIGSLFAAEIMGPIVAVLFPVMASVQSDALKMRQAFLDVFQWSAVLGIAISVGVAICGDDIIDVLLGPKWIDVKPLIPWLALSAGAVSLSASVYSAFDVAGHPNLSAQLQWTRLVLLAIIVFIISYATRNAVYVAAARFGVTIALTPALFVILARTVDFPLQLILQSIWRPSLAALAMAVIIWSINSGFMSPGPVRLLVDVAAGATAFCLASFLLWRVAGCPLAPETYIWDRLRDRRNATA